MAKQNEFDPTPEEVAQFMKEYDMGLHPLSEEDKEALDKARPRLFEAIAKLLKNK